MSNNSTIPSSYVLQNANIATMERGFSEESLIQNGALVVENAKISWVGAKADLPEHYNNLHQVDCEGQWLLPGFIDCHTHLVFAGNRADEFEMRLQGHSYEEIAAAGGGIVNTVKATRLASEEELLALAIERAKRMQEQGVTSIEVKSGYGLNTDTELKMLRVARKISEHVDINVQTTFLGAHALPAEYKGKPDEYINLVCQEMLPKVAVEDLADAIDVFCESIGFNLEQTNKVLSAGANHGLKIKAHVEQLNNLGGSALAASFNALSVDHIEYLDEDGVRAIANSGTVATLLPGAFYFLRETQVPPIDLLRRYKVPMAVATDFNPGSSPIASLPLMLNMACTFFGLTPEEALMGVTTNAAKALGIQNQVGTLTVGKNADIVSWNITHPKQLCYQFGIDKPSSIIKSGVPLE